MELTEAALTGGVPGSTTVKGVSSLLDGDDDIGIAENRAEVGSGGLGTTILLK